jgi:pilus assembly protein CpaB
VRRAASVIVLVLAIGSGIAASLITYRLLSERQLPGETILLPEKPSRPVVVAAAPLTYGTVLQAEHLEVLSWPANAPRGSFSDPQAIIGRAIITEAVLDEPILESKLAPIDALGGLSAVIPRGKRAVSVRVNEIIGVAGFVVPRTRVDVLVSVNPQGDKSRAASRVILQNVEVLAAGQTTERDAEGKPRTVNVITLLVEPGQAEKLTLASNEGDLQLALRNSLDLDEITTSGANLGNMVLGSKKPTVKRTRSSRRAPAPVPESSSVEVIRGSERTVEKFQ